MPEVGKQFFTSASAAVEDSYRAGVVALQGNDFNVACKHFVAAAGGGHVSAYYNLSLLLGGGYVSPYDIDLAADCWYKAAAGEHPAASKLLYQLEAADRGGFGTQNLAKIACGPDADGSLIPSLMICAARFFDVLSRKFGATVDVIAYELDAASMSDHAFIGKFIERTGIGRDFYQGGLNRLKAGSAADQITDGLNELTIAMRRGGVSEKLAIMARCTIVGHIISKSPYGERSQPLKGVDTFFS